jgi:cell division protein ZapA (FtsZ GTPase activity inhibitor)
MNSSMKSIDVEIFGENFAVISDEPEDRVIEASMVVDDLMKEYSAQAPHKEVRKLALLTALQLASKLVETEEILASKRNHDKELEDRIKRMTELGTTL